MLNCEVQELVIADNKAVCMRIPAEDHLYQSDFRRLKQPDRRGEIP